MVVGTLLSLSVHVQDGQEVASEGEEEISLDTLRQQADNVSIFPFPCPFGIHRTYSNSSSMLEHSCAPCLFILVDVLSFSQMKSPDLPSFTPHPTDTNETFDFAIDGPSRKRLVCVYTGLCVCVCVCVYVPIPHSITSIRSRTSSSDRRTSKDLM